MRVRLPCCGLLLCGLLAGMAAVGDPNAPAQHKSPLFFYKFTNELGQAVSLSDFHGQALAVTFFFTRCPFPNFCPRLSKNFQEASQKLAADKTIPTNWHFLSVTFDPDFDTPGVLRSYAERYDYDAAHWSFLTGPPDKVTELARLSGVKADPEGSLFNHNFRTLIIDATGKLQMVFPMGGDLSDAIAEEIRKAVAAR
ncbi:MAG TPA: SCO family protein [Verrucomicrobiae bacterium]|nr:SCO family protein [Verrucomicrobiae bacterium]